MKKVINVNLAGKAFTIDEDAYTELSKYLKSLEKHFSKSQGSEDIIYDIEARIAELFDENNTGGPIVSIAKVEKIKNIMGTPEDFGATESYDSDFGSTTATKKKYRRNKTSTGSRKRKLYRDPENKVFGGVASGLTNYFGFNDPLLLRILLLVLFFSFGTGLFIYILLWIAVPEAKTSSDFLAMRGEEINIDNIAKTVEESLDDLKGKIEEFGNDLKTRML